MSPESTLGESRRRPSDPIEPHLPKAYSAPIPGWRAGGATTHSLPLCNFPRGPRSSLAWGCSQSFYCGGPEEPSDRCWDTLGRLAAPVREGEGSGRVTTDVSRASGVDISRENVADCIAAALQRPASRGQVVDLLDGDQPIGDLFEGGTSGGMQ